MIQASYYCPNPDEVNPICGLKIRDLTTIEFKNNCMFEASNDYFYKFAQRNHLKLNDGKCKDSYTLSEVREAINKETDNLTRPLVVGEIPDNLMRCW